MDAERAEIQERLEEVFQSMPCPVSGCWGLHGCHYEYYYDEGCECHVLEVWPIGFEEPKEHGGNGHQKAGEEKQPGPTISRHNVSNSNSILRTPRIPSKYLGPAETI